MLNYDLAALKGAMFVTRFILSLVAAMVISGVSHAQEMSPAAQRALILGSLAQQLGQSEIGNQALQTQLSAAQKEVQDWKDAFHAWCGTAPNCGRPDPHPAADVPRAMSVPVEPK